jgi:hypothetical protein
VTVTYLLGMGEMAEPAALLSLRVGARLELRRARIKAARGRGRIEVRWPDGKYSDLTELTPHSLLEISRP